MCGISGFNFDDKHLVKAMCNLIIHRGPDDEGYFYDDLVSIGNRRLSVIDLNTGHQPQHNENEDMCIMFSLHKRGLKAGSTFKPYAPLSYAAFGAIGTLFLTRGITTCFSDACFLIACAGAYFL